MNPQFLTFWNLSIDQVLQQTSSTPSGLSSQVTKQRLGESSANSLKKSHKLNPYGLFFNQFNSPIILILIFAAMLSMPIQHNSEPDGLWNP